MVKDLVKAIKWKRTTWIVGNSHASLIGLVSEAWVRRGRPGEERFVLEAPPGVYSPPKKRIHPDVLFVNGRDCVGVAEVEGSSPITAIGKFDQYFHSAPDGFGRSIFGLCVVYPYFLRGYSPDKEWRFTKEVADDGGVEEILGQAKALSQDNPQNPFMLVLVEKDYHDGFWLETQQDKSEYYRGQVSRVTGYLYQNGGIIENLPLLQ